MVSPNQFWITLGLILSDLAIATSSWWMAIHFRFDKGVIPLYHGLPDMGAYQSGMFLILPVWGLTFLFLGMYSLEKRLFLSRELPRVVWANVVGLLAFLTLTLFLKTGPKDSYSRLTLILFLLTAISLMFTTRILSRILLEALHRRGVNLQRAIIVGSGPLVKDLALRLRHEWWAGFQLLGVVVPAREKTDLRRLESSARLDRLIARHRVEHVFVAWPATRHREQKKALDLLVKTAAKVSVVHDFDRFDLLGSTRSHDLAGLQVVNLSEPALDAGGRLAKRLFDIAFSGAVLLFGSPVFLALAIGVKISSPGPVFYRQIRMGIDGRLFPMFKFRSMPVDAERRTGPKWAEKGEQRATRLGAFMRRTSLDELPQFFNVLRGEMSVVGPRPERPVFIRQFRDHIPGYMLRHRMKAGITGWAQISGWRGNTSLEKRIEYDLFYIRNWSFLFDLRIIFLTLLRGFIHPNAY